MHRFVASWWARGISSVTIDNDIGLLERALTARLAVMVLRPRGQHALPAAQQATTTFRTADCLVRGCAC
jgi:hypothetical protein